MVTETCWQKLSYKAQHEKQANRIQATANTKAAVFKPDGADREESSRQERGVQHAIACIWKGKITLFYTCTSYSISFQVFKTIYTGNKAVKWTVAEEYEKHKCLFQIDHVQNGGKYKC